MRSANATLPAGGATGPGAGEGEDAAARSAIARLDEIPGVSRHTAQVILTEVGLDMSRFPTAGHLASWAKLSPRTIQSGPKSKSGRTGQGNPYLKGSARPPPWQPGPARSWASATGGS